MDFPRFVSVIKHDGEWQVKRNGRIVARFAFSDDQSPAAFRAAFSYAFNLGDHNEQNNPSR